MLSDGGARTQAAAHERAGFVPGEAANVASLAAFEILLFRFGKFGKIDQHGFVLLLRSGRAQTLPLIKKSFGLFDKEPAKLQN